MSEQTNNNGWKCPECGTTMTVSDEAGVEALDTLAADKAQAAPPDLDLVAEDDLIDELLGRVDSGVICIRRDGAKGPSGMETRGDMTGDPHVNMGLCVEMCEYLTRQLRDDRNEEDEE